MLAVTYYVSEDGKRFASKNNCMNHNIDLIDWTEFKGTYWVDMNIYRYVNACGIKETNYDIKLIPFEKLDAGVTLYSQFRKPNYYLYIPNEEIVNVFKSYRNYFYLVDEPFIAKLKPGVNYLAEDGDSLDIKNIGCELNSLQKDFREIKEKIEQLEQLNDKVLTRIMTFERNR